MSLGEFQLTAETLDRIASFARKGHLDLDDVLVLHVLQLEDVGTPGDVARESGLSAPAVSRRVAKLRDLDLIAEQVSPDDLRKCLLKPTVKCSSVLYEIFRALPEGLAQQALDTYRRVLAARLRATGRQEGRAVNRTMALVLGALHAAGEPLRIGQIARIACRPQSSISTAASSLRKAGLVRPCDAERIPSSDGRGVFLELTDAGRELHSAINQKPLP